MAGTPIQHEHYVLPMHNSAAPGHAETPPLHSPAIAQNLESKSRSSLDSDRHVELQEFLDNTTESGCKGFFRKYRRPLTHFCVFGFATGWWVTSLVLHHHDRNWVIPFLLWFAIILRLFFYYTSVQFIFRPLRWAWHHTAHPVHNSIPPKFRNMAGGIVTIAVLCVGSFVSEEFEDNNRENRAVSLFGLVFTIFALWVTSKHRKRVNWQTVFVGMLMQYLIALFVLRTTVGYDIFAFIAARAGDLLGFSRQGVAFLTDPKTSLTQNFFFTVIPAIMFFVAIVEVLFYIGFLQWAIRKFASVVNWALAVSGAEAIMAAATPFLGIAEACLLVRPVIPNMTNAEIHQIMTCGFATISGAVLIGYIDLGLDAQALVSSCVMSIPASLAISKLRYPETQETTTGREVMIPESTDKAKNLLHAFAQGCFMGIRVAGSIIAALLCIIASVGLINALMTWWGYYLNINNPTPLTLQLVFSYIFYPVSFLLGIPRNGDLYKVAQIIAEKVVVNEYSAFSLLADNHKFGDLSPRSRLIATYAICGFGNFSSLGLAVGVLSQLAPNRIADISSLGLSALASGVIATLTSASVAGLVITN